MSFKRSHLFTIKRVANELITHGTKENLCLFVFTFGNLHRGPEGRGMNSTRRLYRTKTRNTAQNLKEVKKKNMRSFFKMQR